MIDSYAIWRRYFNCTGYITTSRLLEEDNNFIAETYLPYLVEYSKLRPVAVKTTTTWVEENQIEYFFSNVSHLSYCFVNMFCLTQAATVILQHVTGNASVEKYNHQITKITNGWWDISSKSIVSMIKSRRVRWQGM
jgi:hypothetical protein